MKLLQKIAAGGRNVDMDSVSLADLTKVRDLLKVFADDTPRDDPDAQAYSDLIERVEGLMRDARRRLKLEQLMAFLIQETQECDDVDTATSDEESAASNDDSNSSSDSPADVELVYSRDEYCDALNSLLKQQQ